MFSKSLQEVATGKLELAGEETAQCIMSGAECSQQRVRSSIEVEGLQWVLVLMYCLMKYFLGLFSMEAVTVPIA